MGVKQLSGDPFSTYLAANPKGTIVKGVVTEVDAKAAMIDLGDGIIGQLKAVDISVDRVEDASKVLKEGDEVEAKFVGLDRKTRVVSLSVKAKDRHEEEEAMRDYQSDATSGTSLGDQLKDLMTSSD